MTQTLRPPTLQLPLTVREGLRKISSKMQKACDSCEISTHLETKSQHGCSQNANPEASMWAESVIISIFYIQFNNLRQSFSMCPFILFMQNL